MLCAKPIPHALVVWFALTAVSASAQTPLGTAFLYQGRLTSGDVLVNAPHDFRFRLYDTLLGDHQVGPTVCVDNVSVTDGLFTASLDFGAEFNGDERFLEIDVRPDAGSDCTDATGFVVLGPRQPLAAAPYALKVRGVDGHSLDASDGSPADALFVDAAGAVGVGTTSPLSALHVVGAENNGASAAARIVSGGQTLLIDGNEIDSSDNLHLNFNTSTNVTIANGGGNVTLAGGTGNVAIGAIALTEKLNVAGSIRMADDSNILGVNDIVGYNDLKLFGDGAGGFDLMIGADGNIGQRAIYSNVTFNVRPTLLETQLLRVEDFLGLSVVEVQSDRDVFVIGDFFVNSGSKNFIIDHPLDPTHKALSHNAVEGPGYYTHYHGNVVLGADGTAWVDLPDYFDALNTDPSYQLTCVGGFAQVYVAQEIREHRFQIAGGRAGLKVSWQVHATRADPYAKEHPYRDVRDKSADEVGRYYYPAGYGAPPEASIHWRGGGATGAGSVSKPSGG